MRRIYDYYHVVTPILFSLWPRARVYQAGGHLRMNEGNDNNGRLHGIAFLEPFLALDLSTAPSHENN